MALRWASSFPSKEDRLVYDASTAIEAIELASTPASGNLILDRCFTEMFKSSIRASSITGSKAPARECSYSCAICHR